MTGAGHALPAKKAIRYTGGLWVGNLMNTHSHQKGTTGDAAAMIGESGLRLCTPNIATSAPVDMAT